MSESTARIAPPGHVESPQRIDVGAERVRILADRWAVQWKRPPTNNELAGLIRQWVREEILYREAIDRSLDRDDELVRRRLIQKMNGIARGLAELSEPSETDVRAFYLEHVDRYEIPARRTFRQVYVSIERGEDAAQLHAFELLERILQTPPNEVSRMGDPFVLAHEFALLTEADVAARFGPAFAEAVFALGAGAWEGPIPSSFGFHLVQVSEAVEAYTPSFEEAHDRVVVDVDNQRKVAAEAGLIAALASEYEIDYAWDDGDLEAVDFDGVTQVPDLDLLGTLAVLVPRQRGAAEAARRLPLDETGRPDWGQFMDELHRTGSHGEIALAGGVPRRSTLVEPGDPGTFDDPAYEGVAGEFSRGLRATTGATIVLKSPGWVGLTCDSEEMAAWIIRALAAENLTVRREGSTVYLPVSPSFRVEDEILDMVVAAATVHHFFEDHIRVDDHEHD